MKSKKLHVSWCVSIFVMGVISVLFVASKLIGYELSDTTKLIMLFLDLPALCVLVFTTVKKNQKKQ